MVGKGLQPVIFNIFLNGDVNGFLMLLGIATVSVRGLTTHDAM